MSLIWVDFVRKNKYKPWNWFLLSSSKYITWEIVQKNKDLPWDWSGLSKVIPFNIIEKNPGCKWNDYYLSMNPSINWQIIESNPQINWNIDGLSQNISIPYQDKMDYNWSWYHIKNRNIHKNIEMEYCKENWIAYNKKYVPIVYGKILCKKLNIPDDILNLIIDYLIESIVKDGIYLP